MMRAIKLFVSVQDVSQFMSRSHTMSNLSADIRYRVFDVAWIRHIQSQHKYILVIVSWLWLSHIISLLGWPVNFRMLFWFLFIYDVIMFDKILKISFVIPENNCSPSWMNMKMKMKPWMSFYYIQLWTTIWNGFAYYIVGVIIHLIYMEAV